MANARIVKQVHAGRSSEYYTSITPISGDTIYMAFDGGLNIDDILLRSSGAIFTAYIDIIYPSSEFVQDIETVSFVSGGEWSLNDGANYAAKWYQIPSGASVSFYFSTVTTVDQVEFLVIGR